MSARPPTRRDGTALSLHDVAVAAYLRGLGGLVRVLEIVADHAASTGIPAATFLATPIVPGFLPFGLQADAACEHARYDTALLLGDPGARPPPSVRTFDGLTAATASAIGLVERLDRAALDEAGGRLLVVNGETVSGSDYLLQHSIPHFYFHLTAGTLILRHLGVPLDDPDFLWAAGSEAGAAAVERASAGSTR